MNRSHESYKNSRGTFGTGFLCLLKHYVENHPYLIPADLLTIISILILVPIMWINLLSMFDLIGELDCSIYNFGLEYRL